jgi:hypothetical protein
MVTSAAIFRKLALIAFFMDLSLQQVWNRISKGRATILSLAVIAKEKARKVAETEPTPAANAKRAA